MNHPRIIQGGMGVGVSGWRLARAVSQTGQLGVVSGTALDLVLARRLQDGDPGGHVRRALARFPFPEVSERAVRDYYVPGGKPAGEPYRRLPMPTAVTAPELAELFVVGNFVEVFLAREGHDNPVGINYLEKVQIPHLASIYGAMLAGVAYVLMGAGIPLKVPGALDRLAEHEPAHYTLQVTGALPGEDTAVRFSPREFAERDHLAPLLRPAFLPIIASSALATTLVRKANGRVDGFIIEGPTAGGHNAPPRGKPVFNARHEPVYGERDQVDLDKIRSLGLPFWLAGGYGSPDRLRAALADGATGVQVGTPFAFCAESGLREDYKRGLLCKVAEGDVSVLTDALASPTGFPFKVAHLADTLSDEQTYLARPRICDLGYLRELYREADGALGYRCAAEPPTVYVAKGGQLQDTEGRKCLCNALLANIGHPQTRQGKHIEPGLITAGNGLEEIGRFARSDGRPYTAADVITHLLGA